MGEVTQRVIGHGWTKITAANANINDGLDALAGVTSPCSAANAFCERAHVVKHGPNIWHDILAVGIDDGVARRAKGDM